MDSSYPRRAVPSGRRPDRPPIAPWRGSGIRTASAATAVCRFRRSASAFVTHPLPQSEEGNMQSERDRAHRAAMAACALASVFGAATPALADPGNGNGHGNAYGHSDAAATASAGASASDQTTASDQTSASAQTTTPPGHKCHHGGASSGSQQMQSGGEASGGADVS